MLKFLAVFFLALIETFPALAATTLSADGKTDTYGLINAALAPGGNAVEVPDCGHPEFGPHITQAYDAILKRYVFRFHIHRDRDDDRCRKADRQRTEIKTYARSPDRLKAFAGDVMVFRWKFRLDPAFQPSHRFTHLHQIKAVGGDYAAMPLITLTARKGKKGKPDRMELRHAARDRQKTLAMRPLPAFLGRWLSVAERISFAREGSYEISIRDVLTGAVLFEYENAALATWKEGAAFLRPKWGIYRSLRDRDNLRDEIVDFADFGIVKER